MKPVEPFEVHPPIATDRPNWPAIGASVLCHALLILILLLKLPEGTGAPPPPHRPDGSEPQPIAMPLPALPKPKEKPAEKEPPVREQILGPDTKRPADVPREAIARHPPADPVPDPAGATKTPDPPPPDPKTAAADPAPTESKAAHVPTLGEMLATKSRLSPPTADNAEAKALTDPSHGSDVPAPASSSAARSSVAGRSGFTNGDYREWRPSFPDAAGSCAEIPDLGKNPDGSPVLAGVTGYVYDDDGVTPLNGAHLQILGTAFVTFSRADGLYRLEFDPKLLRKCQIQYVQVMAPGHREQRLMLSIGRKVVSDPVVMHRH